jgi:hypothetical protein
MIGATLAIAVVSALAAITNLRFTHTTECWGIQRRRALASSRLAGRSKTAFHLLAKAASRERSPRKYQGRQLPNVCGSIIRTAHEGLVLKAPDT